MQWNPPWGISILADFRPIGYRLSCCGIFGLGKFLLLKSVLGHCDYTQNRKRRCDVPLIYQQATIPRSTGANCYYWALVRQTAAAACAALGGAAMGWTEHYGGRKEGRGRAGWGGACSRNVWFCCQRKAANQVSQAMHTTIAKLTTLSGIPASHCV